MKTLLTRLQTVTNTSKSEAVVVTTVASLLCLGSIGSYVFKPDARTEIESATTIARILDSLSRQADVEAAFDTLDNVHGTSRARSLAHVVTLYSDSGTPIRRSPVRAVTQSRIHLNTASLTQLDALPGVGPATARAIIARRMVRPFKSADDLLDVKGIGPATLNKIRPYILDP